MTNKADCTKRVLSEFNTDKEVACAEQVAQVVEESGIELTRSLELMLRLLRVPELNFILNAKVTELKFLFGDKLPEE